MVIFNFNRKKIFENLLKQSGYLLARHFIHIKEGYFMKKLIFSFFYCLLSLQCFANDLEELNDKFYLSPGSVYVAPDAIYINLNGSFISVTRIAVDENGLYAVLNSDVRVGYCSKCGNNYSGSLRNHLKTCPANKR